MADHQAATGNAAQIEFWNSRPIDELDPFRLSVRMQVTRVVFTICLKAALDGTLGREAARERDRERIPDELARGFENARKPKATARDP